MPISTIVGIDRVDVDVEVGTVLWADVLARVAVERATVLVEVPEGALFAEAGTDDDPLAVVFDSRLELFDSGFGVFNLDLLTKGVYSVGRVERRGEAVGI